MAHLTPKQQDHQQGDNLKPIVHRGHCNPAGRDPWRDPPVPSASPRFCHFPGYCEVQGKETPALAKHSLPRRRLGQGWGGAGGDRKWFLSTFLPSEACMLQDRGQVTHLSPPAHCLAWLGQQRNRQSAALGP